MKREKISDALEKINCKYINEAVNYKTHGKAWRKWAVIAACLVLCISILLISGVFKNGLPAIDEPSPQPTTNNEENIGTPDKNEASATDNPSSQTEPDNDDNIQTNNNAGSKYKFWVNGTESDIEWQWEYKTVSEKYTKVTFDGKEYLTRTRGIDTKYLGEVLGACDAEGIDFYTNKKYTEKFDVRKINGVSEEKIIAIGNDDGYYVYMLDDSTKPDSFASVMDIYGLPETLELNRFTKYEGYDEKGYFTIEDDTYIWQILSECKDARLYTEAELFERSNRNYLSFTATSDALGVYKRVFYISEDGYIATNIFNYSLIYFIGQENTQKIIGYTESNCAKAEYEPYEQTISGTLTEISKDYILIDDTVLCADTADGTVYKVMTNDIKIKRCLEGTDIKVGDTVVVKYQGAISDINELNGAYSIYKGTLVDGDLAIPE